MHKTRGRSQSTEEPGCFGQVWNVAPPSGEVRCTKCVARAAASAVVVNIVRRTRATCGMVVIREAPLIGIMVCLATT
jgi:hypothetical protein